MATQDWEKFSKNFHSFRQRSFIKNAVLAFGRLFHPRHNQNSAHSKIMKEQSGVFKSPSGEMIRLDFHDQGYYLSEDDRIALNELGVILEQAANLCHRVGAKFLFVFAPTKFRVYKEFTEFNIKSQPYYWVINELPLLMKTMIQDRVHDGRFLDLTPSLVEHAQNGPLLYFNHDTHWSSDGHRIAASAIAKALEQWD